MAIMNKSGPGFGVVILNWHLAQFIRKYGHLYFSSSSTNTLDFHRVQLNTMYIRIISEESDHEHTFPARGARPGGRRHRVAGGAAGTGRSGGAGDARRQPGQVAPCPYYMVF